MGARDTNDDRSPEEIRREIERTRSHLDEAVEAIGDKLSPGRFVDELWHRAQREGAAAVTSSMREHPIPFALVGLGLGWLVMEQARGRGGRVGAGTYERAEGRVGPYLGDAVDRDDPDWAHAGMGTKVKGKVADAAHGVGERLHDAAHSMRESAADVGHRVADAGRDLQERAHAAEQRVTNVARRTSERVTETLSSAAHAASDRARRGAEKAREGFWTMLEQNPMALGAIAFGLGVAAGAVAPTTRWEDEQLGRVAGPLKHEARRAVEDTARKVQGVARDAVDAARDELEHQRDELGDPIQMAVEQMKSSARGVAQAAADAARERAREEELTPEGMKKVAARVRDRTRETTGS